MTHRKRIRTHIMFSTTLVRLFVWAQFIAIVCFISSATPKSAYKKTIVKVNLNYPGLEKKKFLPSAIKKLLANSFSENKDALWIQTNKRNSLIIFSICTQFKDFFVCFLLFLVINVLFEWNIFKHLVGYFATHTLFFN